MNIRMTILNIRKLTHAFGAKPLIEDGNLVISRGDKLCLLGRNGMGKSTLLKIIAGKIDPDSGSIEKEAGTKISFLQQVFPSALNQSVYQVVAAEDTSLQAHQINKILSKLSLDAEINFDDLSGGLKRRTLLAKALVTEPDILLLDEPTNHLDIESIQWLENFLKAYNGTLILVTHDRQLMQSIGNHFVEIDHGKLITWRGTYEGFIKHKEYSLNAEQLANQQFDKKLKQEEVWIRQGIKARRTRNEGRVRALKKMREAFKERRTKIGKINISEQTSSLSGKEIFLVDDISFSYNNKVIIKDFSCVIQRGDKIGILGANGSGKSTLLKLLLKDLEPNKGTIKHGTKLHIAYYDQHRQALNEEKSIFDNVCEGSDYIEISGKKVHLMSYLQDFLFSPQQVHTPVKSLSGGERNRIILAKLFMKPSNLMILDEPTNDLDIETLELLEEQLMNYTGTVLLVSHDRQFINNIVTSTLVFEDNGKLQEYAGGYDDWLLQSKRKKVEIKAITDSSNEKQEKPKSSSGKLSFKEKYELEHLPKQIEMLENEIFEMQHKLSRPELYKEEPDIIAKVNSQLSELQMKLEQCYSRWEVLENKNINK